MKRGTLRTGRKYSENGGTHEYLLRRKMASKGTRRGEKAGAVAKK